MKGSSPKCESEYVNVDLLVLSQTTNFGLSQTERVCRRQFQF